MVEKYSSDSDAVIMPTTKILRGSTLDTNIPAIGIMMYPDCGESSWVAAPQFTNPGMNYVHEGKRGTVRLYRNVDQRFIQEDFFAKLNRFTRGIREFAKFGG